MWQAPNQRLIIIHKPDESVVVWTDCEVAGWVDIVVLDEQRVAVALGATEIDGRSRCWRYWCPELVIFVDKDIVRLGLVLIVEPGECPDDGCGVWLIEELDMVVVEPDVAAP